MNCYFLRHDAPPRTRSASSSSDGVRNRFLLDANEDYFKKNGEPLFSSHMLDLSEEPLEENIEICVAYMQRMAKMDMLLEMELGITGGEEDGVDNENANPEDLYTKPEEVWQVYEALSKVGTPLISAAAGLHGIWSMRYAPVSGSMQ